MKKYILSIIFLAMIVLPMNAQEAIIFHFQGGAKQSVKLDNIKSITFSGSNLLLKPVTGSAISFLLNDFSKITFGDMIMGLSENQETDVNIYPNPAREVLYIDIPSFENLKHLNIEICDLAGRTVRTVETQNFASLQGNTTINVSTLPQGIYFVKIHTDKGVVTKRFIKM